MRLRRTNMTASHRLAAATGHHRLLLKKLSNQTLELLVPLGSVQIANGAFRAPRLPAKSWASRKCQNRNNGGSKGSGR